MPFLVAHAHHADGTRLDDRQRVHRLLAEHQRVQRVAVVAEGPGDEAVVGGIVNGAVEHAVEAQQPRLLVQLVLVLAALGNLDDYGKRRLDERVVHVAVVPGVHLFNSTPSETANHGIGMAVPAELVVSAGADIAHQCRTEAGEAFTAGVPDGAVHDAVRSALKQLVRERLRLAVVVRIVAAASTSGARGAGRGSARENRRCRPASAPMSRSRRPPAAPPCGDTPTRRARSRACEPHTRRRARRLRTGRPPAEGGSTAAITTLDIGAPVTHSPSGMVCRTPSSLLMRSFVHPSSSKTASRSAGDATRSRRPATG